ncbi:MAG TPA: flavin reductase [Rhodocyclaceae bacterium]|nr:flavin reductase [Rhodocyclaceae bacterium]
MSFSPIAVPLAKAYILLNHGPTTLVTSAHGERRNVMAASWAMPLDFEPPKVAVAIDSRTLTRELIEGPRKTRTKAIACTRNSFTHRLKVQRQAYL